MDELNTETMKQIKDVCHEFTVNGDFIRNYGNVYHSILTECSNQSAGISSQTMSPVRCMGTCADRLLLLITMLLPQIYIRTILPEKFVTTQLEMSWAMVSEKCLNTRP